MVFFDDLQEGEVVYDRHGEFRGEVVFKNKKVVMIENSFHDIEIFSQEKADEVFYNCYK